MADTIQGYQANNGNSNLEFVTTTKSGTKTYLDINAVTGGIVPTSPVDAVTVTYPSATQEVYAFRSGGIAGTIVYTITVNYTDSTKVNLLNAFRT